MASRTCLFAYFEFLFGKLELEVKLWGGSRVWRYFYSIHYVKLIIKTSLSFKSNVDLPFLADSEEIELLN